MNILDQEIILEFFRDHYVWFMASVFLATFTLTFYLIPKILQVSIEKNLMATVNEGSVHQTATPAFGGVAFYITIMLVLCILQSMRLTFVGNHLIAAITILFMVGLRDDLVESSARVKLLGQITAALFLIFSPELMLTSLHGFLGIYEIHALAALMLKAFIVIALINAYNLLDGIDGLGAITGIIIAGTFAMLFYHTGHAFYVLVCISMVGMLVAFLRFNFSQGTRKLFMGDSGSLLIGLILAFMTIKYLGIKPHASLIAEGYSPANRILFLACILFLPVFDTLRVILVRLRIGHPVFTPDRNHSYHVLLDLGLSHVKACLVMGLMNLGVIVVFIQFSRLLEHQWLLFLVVFFYSSTFLLFAVLKGITAKKCGTAVAELSGTRYRVR